MVVIFYIINLLTKIVIFYSMKFERKCTLFYLNKKKYDEAEIDSEYYVWIPNLGTS